MSAASSTFGLVAVATRFADPPVASEETLVDWFEETLLPTSLLTLSRIPTNWALACITAPIKKINEIYRTCSTTNSKKHHDILKKWVNEMSLILDTEGMKI